MASTTAVITSAPTGTTTRPTSPNARSVGAGSATDVTSPIDSGSIGGTGSGTLVDAPVYPHTSTFESDQMAVTISSPHLELTFPNGNDGAIVKLPVFSAKDSIGGTISVNPAAYPNSSNAKIVVSVRTLPTLNFCFSSPNQSRPLYDKISWKEHSIGQNQGQHHSNDHIQAPNADTVTKRMPPPPIAPNVERKHVFLFSSLSLPLSDDDAPASSTAFDTIMLNKQQALAAVRRRMSYGKAEASKLLERARRKKSVGTVEDIGGNVMGVLGLVNTTSRTEVTSNADVTSPTPEGKSAPAVNTTDPMLTATPWVSKTFMFHLPLQQGDGSTTLLPPSVDLRAEAAEREKGKTKLVDDVRIQYKLVARYESGLLSLAKNLEVPIIFEPGSDPESFYATPQPPIRWRETPMELGSKQPNGGSLPFRAMLTLPNPPIFARDSDSFFFVAFSTIPSSNSKELSATISSSAKISLTISCTYRFDARRAAAHSSRGNDVNPPYSTAANAKEEAIWKWQDPPGSPLKRGNSSRKGSQWETIGSHSTTIRRVTGDSVKSVKANGSRPTSPPVQTEFGILGEGKDEKPLPTLPPPTPVSDDGGPRRISTPLPTGGFKEDHEGERTIVLLSTSRTGFPHRPKVKPDQTNLPEGLWKGQLNYQWWMIPTVDCAGLEVKYHMEVAVEINGMTLRTKKQFRIVEPHTVRKEEKVLQMRKVELDAFV